MGIDQNGTRTIERVPAARRAQFYKVAGRMAALTRETGAIFHHLQKNAIDPQIKA
jgi:uncharacterized glyoxalase superfamily metalloenzyme YdcJ